MKHTLIATCSAALALTIASTATATAQSGTIFLTASGGASIPAGEFKENGANIGWMGRGGLGYNVANNVFVAAFVMLGRNSIDRGGGEATLPGAAGTIGYTFRGATSKAAPYVRAAFGVLGNDRTHIYSDAVSEEWSPFVGAAAGILWPVRTTGVFVEASYDVRNKTEFALVSAGLRIVLKRGK